MTTFKLSGGDLGSDYILVQADLSRPESQVCWRVSWGDDDEWETTQYQASECWGKASRTGLADDGIIAIGKRLAAECCGIDEDEFSCEAVEVDEE